MYNQSRAEVKGMHYCFLAKGRVLFCVLNEGPFFFLLERLLEQLLAFWSLAEEGRQELQGCLVGGAGLCQQEASCSL